MKKLFFVSSICCSFLVCQGCLDLFVLIDPIPPIRPLWRLETVSIEKTGEISVVCALIDDDLFARSGMSGEAKQFVVLQSSMDNLISAHSREPQTRTNTFLGQGIDIIYDPSVDSIVDKNNGRWTVSWSQTSQLGDCSGVIVHPHPGEMTASIPVFYNNRQYTVEIMLLTAVFAK